MGMIFWIMVILAYVMALIIMLILEVSLPIIFIVSLIFFAIAYVISRKVSGGWKVKVECYTKRGYAWPIFYDNYRHIKKQDGDEYGELKKAKCKIKPIDYSFIERDERGKFLLKMASPAKGEYHPIKFDQKTRQLVGVVDPFLMNWLTTENKRAALKWQKHSALATLLQFLPVIIIVVACVLMLVIFMDEMIKLNGPLMSAVDRIATSSDRLADALAILNRTA